MSIIDLLFVLTGVAFHLLIACIYVASRHERLDLVRRLGSVVIALAFPVSVMIVHSLLIGRPLKTLLYLAAILLYLGLEFVLDFILKIEFRKKPAIHIPYIVVFYVACFSFIGVSFSLDNSWGYIVSVSFWILLASLIYLLRGGKKTASTN
jgi:hypothetical protein